ncbi:hypothetical protein EJ04DRAFT_526435 [Polyplosphaeria fusca]|uniref:Uncharacterized protein n=1 Tax=Polyplosphaeria fusca TaxID=682080 RepID=A0A9P4UY66_9PLEO|nr:hypothetical protein EJ04DRAFT_526435 [Polyplosphaeria fusca]
MRPHLYCIFAVFTAALTSATLHTAKHNDIAPRLSLGALCGDTNGDCNKNGCKGINFPGQGDGICTAGDYRGCPCNNICGRSGKCDKHSCKGVNDPTGDGPGRCTAGDFVGCECESVCGPEPGPCDHHDCQGVNMPGGQDGFCTAGKFNGCMCKSICGDKQGSCGKNGCNGRDGICQGGNARGCPCGDYCGNLKPGRCDKKGCAGVRVPEWNIGVCTEEFKGCEVLLRVMFRIIVCWFTVSCRTSKISAGNVGGGRNAALLNQERSGPRRSSRVSVLPAGRKTSSPTQLRANKSPSYQKIPTIKMSLKHRICTCESDRKDREMLALAQDDARVPDINRSTANRQLGISSKVLTRMRAMQSQWNVARKYFGKSLIVRCAAIDVAEKRYRISTTRPQYETPVLEEDMAELGRSDREAVVQETCFKLIRNEQPEGMYKAIKQCETAQRLCQQQSMFYVACVYA